MGYPTYDVFWEVKPPMRTMRVRDVLRRWPDDIASEGVFRTVQYHSSAGVYLEMH